MKCFKYTFKSPLNGTVYCEGLVEEDDNRVDFGPYGVLQLYNRGQDVLMFLTDKLEDLKDYVPQDLKGLVVKAEFGDSVEYRGGLYLLTQVCTRRELTEDELDTLANWIRGQLSDGWGESLENEAVFEEDVRFDKTVFDEDTCEFEESYEHHTARYYLHPWQYSGNWTLELVSTEPVEMDIKEDNKEQVLKEINDNLVELLRRLEELT